MKSSLQVDVSKHCSLSCKYCVSKMNPTRDYSPVLKSQDWLEEHLEIASQSCEVMVLTGTGEPLQNLSYVTRVLRANDIKSSRRRPMRLFDDVELQTNGKLLSHSVLSDLDSLGVSLVAVSCANPFSVDSNFQMTGGFVSGLGYMIQAHNMVSRLTVVLNKGLECYKESDYLTLLEKGGYDQLTFKRMWRDNKSEISDWITENDCSDDYVKYLKSTICGYGYVRLDNACMTKDWLVLRPWGLCNDWHTGMEML